MNAPVLNQVEITPVQTQSPTRWLRIPVLVSLAAVLVLLLVYAQTASSIVAIWMRSETFVHGFVVVPICLWLVWRDRAEIGAHTAIPWWPGVFFAFAAGALWFVMSVANVNAGRQFALAFMIQAVILTVVGRSVGRALFFPLAFLLFAVPAGEIFIPALIDWTANFTVAALRLSGVPVYREGNNFFIPSGVWSVVEACSGVRYLIASVMVGVLYAAINYRSPRRRLLFVAVSIVVPIVANWMRAYGIVMIGHLTNNKYAVGIDHLIYGWVFFGFVMLLMLWVGSWWREDAAPGPEQHAELAAIREPTQSGGRGPLVVAALVAVAAASVWRPLAAWVDSPTHVGREPALAAVASTPEWPAAAPFVSWKPRYRGYAGELVQTFGSRDAPVGLYVAYYADQESGRELVTSENLLVARDDWRWKEVATGSMVADWAGTPTTFERTTIAGSTQSFLTWHLFWIDGHVTSSPYVAKAWRAWVKLSGRGDDSALIVLYTPADKESADARLRGFSKAMSASIERTLAAAGGQHP